MVFCRRPGGNHSVNINSQDDQLSAAALKFMADSNRQMQMTHQLLPIDSRNGSTANRAHRPKWTSLIRPKSSVKAGSGTSRGSFFGRRRNFKRGGYSENLDYGPLNRGSTIAENEVL